jgi:XTP/dITP diphosphohydrolase
MKIVIGTRNEGKIREINRYLNVSGLEVFNLNDFSGIEEPVESGRTFRENAVLKALSYAKQTGNLALADDSGLEVFSLDGRPGVFSARFGGLETDHKSKIRILLGMMADKNEMNRAARFVCAMAIADEKGVIIYEAEGICEGRIAESPRGTKGFGYDPIFIPRGFSMTFGELDEVAKQEISHRGIALKKIISFLRDFSLSSLDS